MMKIGNLLLIGTLLILPTPVLADDETRSGFDDKGRDHAAHVEVHVHEHPEVRDASAKPEPFKDQGTDVVKETEVHAHEHPEVRDAPGKPEPYKSK